MGSGSGLFSLAAVRLGAERVHSFDFDPQSVHATQELRRRYAPEAEHWTVEEGSVLDRSYIERLGEWDIVYSWGVLHHTGDMDGAMDHAALAVAPAGQLFIALYDDQGRTSRAWRRVKRLYNALPTWLRKPYAVLVMLPFELRAALGSMLRLEPQSYWRRWTQYQESRGMSHWHDLLDWVGGYPFEVATPELVFDFYRSRGFTLSKLRTVQRATGCNEFVFVRAPTPATVKAQ
jgi:2-polyprenyl-6-hydroxyphenyl methylase/3-demethylubiquinone-9 3-methyltransferase